MMLTIGLCVAVIGAYAAGYLVGARSATLEKCQAKIDTANDKTAAAEQSAQMWRRRALGSEQRLSQFTADVTTSTTMLLDEIDESERRWSTYAGEVIGRSFAESKQAQAELCPHGKRSACEWCDARPALVRAR